MSATCNDELMSSIDGGGDFFIYFGYGSYVVFSCFALLHHICFPVAPSHIVTN